MKKENSNKIYLFNFALIPLLFAAILPVFPFTCFPVRDGGIFKSFDQGETWQQKVTISKKQTLSSTNVLNISIDPKDQNIIYLGTRGEGVYKTMDGGEIWYHIDDLNQALDKRANVYDVAIDPQNNSNLYVGVYQERWGRLLRSSDAGRSFEEVYRVSREQYAIFAVEIDSFDPSIIYIGTAEGGFLKSVDFGKSWKLIKWFDDAITDIKVNPSDTRIVFVSTYKKGIYKTTDKGQNWESLEGLKKFPREVEEMNVLVMDKKNVNVLYTGSKYCLLKSVDSGQSWEKVNIVIPPESVAIQSIALDSFTSSSLYYGAGNVVYRSYDNGQTWTVHPIETTKSIKNIVVDPRNPNILYIGTHE